MNSQHRNNPRLDLNLQEVVSSDLGVVPPSAVELELAMTNSAFGFEYAALALNECHGVGGPEVLHLQMQIDQYKRDYFAARRKLEKLDGTRLQRFEKDLAVQKIVAFTAPPTYLH